MSGMQLSPPARNRCWWGSLGLADSAQPTGTTGGDPRAIGVACWASRTRPNLREALGLADSTRATRGLAIAILLVVATSASAAEPTYWGEVRPILRKHCTVCHSERRLDEPDVSAGLALDSPAAIRKGGKVPVLVPKAPDKSLLVTLLTTKDAKRAMPLDADPLAPEEIALLRKWVEIGAPEGTKPADDGAVTIAAPAAKFRKLPVAFPTKAVLPKSAKSKAAGTLELTLPIGPLPPVAALAFRPDGQQLAVGVYGRVTLWDLATGKPVKVLTNVLGAVNDLKYSPDGSLLAVAGGQPSARGDLRLFTTKDWKLVGTLGGHKDVVSSVAFAPDGKQIASASFDKTVRFWDIRTPAKPTVLHTYTGHSDFVYAVAFSPDGAWYATASKDNSGRAVDAKTGQGKWTFSGGDQEMLAVAVAPGDQAITSGLEPQLQFWDAKTGDRIKKVSGPGTTTFELALDGKGLTGVAAGGDRTVRTFDVKSMATVKTLPHGAIVFSTAINPAGTRVASGGADGTVKLWDAAEGTLLATLWSGAGDDWLVLTPEGAFAGSGSLLAKGVWNAAGKPAEPAPTADPAAVAKALAVK